MNFKSSKTYQDVNVKLYLLKTYLTGLLTTNKQ